MKSLYVSVRRGTVRRGYYLRARSLAPAAAPRFHRGCSPRGLKGMRNLGTVRGTFYVLAFVTL